MNLDSLSPEEIDILLEALQAKKGGGGDNQAEEDSKFAGLAQAVEALTAKVSALDEEVDKLMEIFVEQIVNPISEGVEANRRMEGIKGLSDKYGDKFGPYKELYGQMTGNADIFERLFDELEEAKAGSPEWNEEAEGGKIEELVKALEEKKNGLKSVFEEKKPEAKAVEIETVKAAPVDDESKVRDMVAKMKKRGIPGMPR
jgi:hypothetical protein